MPTNPADRLATIQERVERMKAVEPLQGADDLGVKAASFIHTAYLEDVSWLLAELRTLQQQREKIAAEMRLVATDTRPFDIAGWRGQLMRWANELAALSAEREPT